MYMCICEIFFTADVLRTTYYRILIFLRPSHISTREPKPHIDMIRGIRQLISWAICIYIYSPYRFIIVAVSLLLYISENKNILELAAIISIRCASYHDRSLCVLYVSSNHHYTRIVSTCILRCRRIDGVAERDDDEDLRLQFRPTARVRAALPDDRYLLRRNQKQSKISIIDSVRCTQANRDKNVQRENKSLLETCTICDTLCADDRTTVGSGEITIVII